MTSREAWRIRRRVSLTSRVEEKFHDRRLRIGRGRRAFFA
jgi:hypothetical protein